MITPLPLAIVISRFKAGTSLAESQDRVGSAASTMAHARSTKAIRAEMKPFHQEDYLSGGASLNKGKAMTGGI